jgi:hypothetical protein
MVLLMLCYETWQRDRYNYWNLFTPCEGDEYSLISHLLVFLQVSLSATHAARARDTHDQKE